MAGFKLDGGPASGLTASCPAARSERQAHALPFTWNGLLRSRPKQVVQNWNVQWAATRARHPEACAYTFWTFYTDMRRMNETTNDYAALQAQPERMTRACVLPGQRWRRIGDSNS